MTGYLRDAEPDFVSHDGNATYLAVSLKPTGDKDEQDAAKQIADDLDGQPGVTVGGIALAQEQVNKQVEKDLRKAELLAFPILFLLSLLFFRSAVAALLPLLIGGLAIVGTFLLLRIANEFVVGLDLRPQPDHGARARPGDRLQPVRRLPIPRGDRKFGPGRAGDEADDEHRRPHGALLLDHRRRGAGLADGLPAALPLLDGPRRRAGRAARRHRSR